MFKRFFLRLFIIKNLFKFLWQNKLWWMIPLIFILIIFFVILIFAQGSPLGPFIYTIF
ncbi:MAG: DUF5989 family protein [Candidatus Goldbacteria bacterium]|nr:DUF5989 family protein [Candidatus Goldiibacteriota bacterium]